MALDESDYKLFEEKLEMVLDFLEDISNMLVQISTDLKEINERQKVV